MIAPVSRASALERAPLQRLPLIAGVVALLALAVGSVGVPTRATEALLVGSAALVGAEWVRRFLVAVRSGRGTELAMAVLLLLGVGIVATIAADLLTLTLGWALVAVLAAIVLLVSASRIRARTTPWSALADRGVWRRSEVLHGLVGVALAGVAAYLAVVGWSDLLPVHPGRAVALLVVAGMSLVGGVAWLLYRRNAGQIAEPHHDEPAIAAHLHDSVLQTLALIGRNAEDPARVRQLALQQERSLRDWLAGRDGTKADSLAAAVRLVAQEVEDEEPGVRVEVVAVGDAPLDRAADAMVRAAREAIRNAARHAGSPVRVFVEVDGGVRELFVRDTGPGFDLAAVADERRGVRDAIIGRMQHVGGSATIDSSSTGTEIALRYEDRG